jgi:hypothetical protein
MLQQIANSQGDTVTLKEIIDITGTRHDNAKVTVQRMATDPNFGPFTVTQVMVNIGSNAQRQIETYVLTKRQSLMVVAYLKVGAVGFLVDYWTAREAQHLSAGGATNELLRKVAELEGKLNYSEMSRRLVQEQLTKYQHYDDSAL